MTVWSEARIEKNLRCKRCAGAEDVLFGLDIYSLVGKEILQLSKLYLAWLVRGWTCQKPCAAMLSLEFVETATIVRVSEVAKDCGRAGPFDVVLIFLITLTGQGKLTNSRPGLASRRVFFTSCCRIESSNAAVVV